MRCDQQRHICRYTGLGSLHGYISDAIAMQSVHKTSHHCHSTTLLPPFIQNYVIYCSYHAFFQPLTCSITKVFNHWHVQSSRLSTIDMFNHWHVQSSRLSTIHMFNHEGFQQLTCSIIKAFNHSHVQPWRLSTIDMFNHQGFQPFTCSTMKAFNH